MADTNPSGIEHGGDEGPVGNSRGASGPSGKDNGTNLIRQFIARHLPLIQ